MEQIFTESLGQIIIYLFIYIGTPIINLNRSSLIYITQYTINYY